MAQVLTTHKQLTQEAGLSRVSETEETKKMGNYRLRCDGSRPGVQSASLYDNFFKTGNDVIDDVIVWVQDGNCEKNGLREF